MIRDGMHEQRNKSGEQICITNHIGEIIRIQQKIGKINNVRTYFSFIFYYIIYNSIQSQAHSKI
jgi:hypothetical protein